MFPPKLIKPYVISFCRTVVREPTPHFVPVRARTDVELRSCFTTVPQQVQEQGGSLVVGWAVWEWPDVMIEAEYHCVWQSPAGEEVDVTPKDPPVKRIVFLPDPHHPYEGFQRDNIRKPLCRDNDVLHLIELSRLMHDEMNRGDLKHQHGEVAVRGIYAAYLHERNMVGERLMNRYGEKLSDLGRHAL